MAEGIAEDQIAVNGQASRIPAGLQGVMLSVLRVAAGLLFMQHGVQKLFGLLMSPGREWSGPPELFSQMWFAGVLETFGGLLIVIGLLTRPVALLLAGEMVVAYFQVHFSQSPWPILNRGEPAALFCVIYLYLAAAGAGPVSVDALLAGRTGRTGRTERMEPARRRRL